MNRNIVKIFINVAILFLLFNSHLGFGQVNVLGRPGHVMTPSADWTDENNFGLNVSYLPENHAINFFMGDYFREIIYGFRLGFTDFLELNFNITYLPDRDRIGIGDRHADVRLRILKENEKFPALVLILTPPGSAANFLSHNALVATKHFDVGIGDFSFTLGYSLPYMFEVSRGIGSNLLGDRSLALVSKKDLNIRYLNGLFSAFVWTPYSWLGIMGEYDGSALNGGLFLKYKELAVIQLNAYSFREIGGSFGLSFPLNFDMKELRKYEKR
ncbi:hypothetical protein B879_03493 [Cecembia lonarensis LW9]|uniref:Uncharacterized protein n=2 Tax=Cecembia TaxID=1187078 RepID=K1KUQ1_CECL9|nr:hypothetical protein B879_03493 [Cecembia lonarensis LW9]